MDSKIVLRRGESLTVNGYEIRAIGLVTNKPDQLQITKPNRSNIWGGLGDDVVVAYSIVIGDDPKGLPKIVRQHTGNLTRKEIR